MHFERVSLETLLDSPVFAGPHFKRVDLDPGGPRPVFLNLFAEDEKDLLATDEQLDAHRNLVRQADRLFGARHFAHYDLLLALYEDRLRMGLEHHQSSENSVKAGYFRDWAKNAIERTLVPHEFAHSWNGKFRRPRDLWVADFNAPTRNSLLWVYEGQTQYWGQVLVAHPRTFGRTVIAGRFRARILRHRGRPRGAAALRLQRRGGAIGKRAALRLVRLLAHPARQSRARCATGRPRPRRLAPGPDRQEERLFQGCRGLSQAIELLFKDGTDYRVKRIDYAGGLRYPQLERIEGAPDRLTPILSAR